MAGVRRLICPTLQQKYFYPKGWTAFADLPVGLLCRRHLSLQMQAKQCMRAAL
jgi:hypothetical protein